MSQGLNQVRSSAPNDAAQSKLLLAPRFQREPCRTFPWDVLGQLCHLPAAPAGSSTQGVLKLLEWQPRSTTRVGGRAKTSRNWGSPNPTVPQQSCKSPQAWLAIRMWPPHSSHSRVNVRKPQAQPERGQNLLDLSSATSKLVFAWLQDLRAGQAAVEQLLHIVLLFQNRKKSSKP